MNILVVDDEPVARLRLIRLLGELGIVGDVSEAGDAQAALEQVRARTPDVMLLDIRMPGIDGIEFAAQTPQLPPVIFVTAYDAHAVAAFEAGAVDYLLKPVRRDRLATALGRALARSGDERQRADALARQYLSRDHGSDASVRLSVSEGGRLHVFDARTIARFYAADKYTGFRVSGHEYLIEDSLSALEKRLEPFGFVRVHRSELVSLAQVKRLSGTGGCAVVELSTGEQARVSRRLLPKLRRALRSEIL